MSSDKYLLARGYQPSTRLNFLFYLWKEAIGYVLHPAIPVPEEGWKVADVATGTGLWLCELAKNAPEATSFDGFDISSDQFPHPHSLPENVTLGVLDVTKPPPLDLCGKYDVVHVRLLISVVDNDDPGPVISHCLSLLKPGGYLQWDELDCAASQRLLQSTESPSPYLGALNKIFSNTKPTGWISRLPDFFEGHGLHTVAIENHTEKEWQRHMMMEIWCLTAEDHASVLEGMGMTEKAEAVRSLAIGAHAEIKEGLFYSHKIRVAVGKVPRLK